METLLEDHVVAETLPEKLVCPIGRGMCGVAGGRLIGGNKNHVLWEVDDLELAYAIPGGWMRATCGNDTKILTVPGGRKSHFVEIEMNPSPYNHALVDCTYSLLMKPFVEGKERYDTY